MNRRLTNFYRSERILDCSCVAVASSSASNMTTPKETALSMSRLSIREIPQTAQSESNSSGRASRRLNWKARTTKWVLESKDDVFSCVKLSGQDMDMSAEGEVGRPDVNKDRPLAFDKREDGVSCAQCGRDLAATSCKALEGDDIHINENYGTIFIDVGSQRMDDSSIGVEAEAKETSLQSQTNSVAHSFPKSPRAIFDGFRSSKKARQNRLEINGAKRRPHQTSRNGWKIKRKRTSTKLKSVLRQISRVKEYDNAGCRAVNINVVNNTRSIIVGDNISYYEGLRKESTGGDQLTRDAGVVADGAIVVPSPQIGPVFYIDKNAIKWLERFYVVINEIYPLRDNGRWGEFYEKVDTGLRLARQNGLDEVEVFMTIEKSIALRFEGKNDKSKEMVKQANYMILSRPRLNARELLVAKSHCHLAALYRRELKFSKANNAVSIAERNAEVVPSSLSRALVIYEKASNLYTQHFYLSQSTGQERDHYAELAKNEYKNCISTCERLLSEKDTVYLRKHHFCYVKLALLNLKCETTSARDQPINEACIREASDCITRMQQRYSGEMNESTAMLLHAAETGHFYRRGDYANAEICARKALRKAESSGFHSEVQELQERLGQMSLLKQQQEMQAN